MSLASLTASFRSILALPSQQIRGMAAKAAATPATKATTKPKTAKKATPTAKKAAPANPKKAAAPAKPKKIVPVALPKRPSSPWNLFFVEHLNKAKALGKDVVPTQETAVAAALWHKLSDAEKEVYQQRYKTNFAIFKNEMDARMNELTPQDFQLENARRTALRAAGKRGLPNLKDPNAPRRPLSAFFRFSKELRAEGKFSHMAMKDQARAFADAWRTLPDHQKKQYSAVAELEFADYKIKKTEFLNANK